MYILVVSQYEEGDMPLSAYAAEATAYHVASTLNRVDKNFLAYTVVEVQPELTVAQALHVVYYERKLP